MVSAVNDDLARLESPLGFCLLVHATDPIRGEMPGLDRLGSLARLLAEWCVLGADARSRVLTKKFRANEKAFFEAYRFISEAYQKRERLGSDADWLLDNFHIIADAFEEVHTDLPAGYSRLLPKLGNESLEGYPRVYAIAFELITHCDSCIGFENIRHFVEAFQSVSPLTIGELWAVPIMLRLVLLENLRRLAEQIVQSRSNLHHARTWVNHLLEQRQDGSVHHTFHSAPGFLHPLEKWTDSFLVHLLELMHEEGTALLNGIEWLENHLTTRGASAAEIVRREQQHQAANQVSIGNSVTSLRVISALDWTEFFEKTCLVDEVLRQDPTGTYSSQDFPTRDRYRKVIEKVARGAHKDELVVAQKAISMARSAAGPAGNGTTARGHVGFYLIDEGRHSLEKAVGFRPDLSTRLHDLILRFPHIIYFGGIALFTTLIVAGLAWGLLAGNIAISLLCLFVLAALLPASELAMGFMNYWVSWIVSPRVLAKLDFKNGIASECQTFVVVPSLVGHTRSATALLERLETHYLSNPDPALRFALLTDFTDATSEYTPDDEGILRVLIDGIKSLNENHSGNNGAKFFLCHRRRQWNPTQSCWMGWERKRGKLVEFNRLLRGDPNTSFQVIVGDFPKAANIRYVITLDADTELPSEAAQRLIATIAHPLNQARFDARRRRVIGGYGVLQPRISLTLPAARKSLFARIYSGSAGLDPYTTAVSDTYQDLFGSGSFTGKGIYDVDAFTAAVDSRFPDNRILSHDLIEGNYARCGLATDIELFDEFPALYRAYACREHRWVRGDWQILSWLLPRVPTPKGGKERNELPTVERWKIFDNLRRSLLPPSLLILLVLGWMAAPFTSWQCSLFVLIVMSWRLLPPLASIPVHLGRALLRDQYWSTLRGELPATAAQILIQLIFLAEQSIRMVDAIARALFRVYYSHRFVLEWETAASTERRLRKGRWRVSRESIQGACLALILGSGLVLIRVPSLYAAGPFLACWLFAPLVEIWLSLPATVPAEELKESDRRQLRRLACRTWSFFDTVVAEPDHWLPPDNWQENRAEPLAHRTSPTNIGFYLLATLAAHDFGYLNWLTLLARLENAFSSLGQLERSHGHFYNWYDTLTLQPLQPTYISSVDSGNLLACLMALKQGLHEGIRADQWAARAWHGFRDIHAEVEAELRALEAPQDADAAQPTQQLEVRLSAILRLLEAPPTQELEKLAELKQQADDLTQQVDALARAIGEPCEDLQAWAQRFAQLAQSRLEEAHSLGGDALTLLEERSRRLIERCERLAADMDFKILYNSQRRLFSVGYNMSLGRLDNAYYDLLASEACLTSFLAVARGQVPKEHWFQLARPFIRAADSVVLLSWGGTMFEYLMPRLLMNCLPETLLEQSQRAAVARQMEYGRQRGVPWGISESAYALTDADFNYQYQAFGVPGLGLKRGLAKDLVIAPYACILAVMIRPTAAASNLRLLAKDGGEGRFGLYEAIDYTPSREQDGHRPVVVKCFMAHHQGMSLIALANCLDNHSMQRRFHADPVVRATSLLLQERIPQEVRLAQPVSDDVSTPVLIRQEDFLLSRKLTTPHTPHPHTYLLASGKSTVMVTNSGAGFSRHDGLAITRWREDRTCDCWGQFIYIKDVHTGQVWSAGFQPARRDADEYEVTFSVDKAEFRRIDEGIETHLEVTVSPEDHAEVRRLTFTNHSTRPRTLEVTSYLELVLTPQGNDLAHPAFGKLFMETEFIPSEHALLCRVRPRNAEQKPIWGMHVLAVDRLPDGQVQYETDRNSFLGRQRSVANPAALDDGAVLGGNIGAVLDPIFSLRRRLILAPDTTAYVAFTTGIAESRERALDLADHYHDFHGVTRAFELAWAHSQIELRHQHLSAEDAHLYQRIAGHVIYSGPALRHGSSSMNGTQAQAALWRLGIPGDNPIVLVRIGSAEKIALVRQLVAAHAYWRSKGLVSDLLILNEHETSYFEDLQQQLQGLLHASEERSLLDKPGGIFLRKGVQASPDDWSIIESVCRCVFIAGQGSLAAQLERGEELFAPADLPVRRVPESPAEETAGESTNALVARREALAPLFFNGLGGFSADGREYVTFTNLSDFKQKYGRPARATGARKPAIPNVPPAPWINVIANPSFGFLISDSGGGCTWATNSQSNRLTPWNNDPVTDLPGEIIYLRDEASGASWIVTSSPKSGRSQLLRHGQGYSVFEQISHHLRQELLLFVPWDESVKCLRLVLRNLGKKRRRISAFFYVEWVLGTVREQAPERVLARTERDLIIARNIFEAGRGPEIAFAGVNGAARALATDRTAFLGRNGSPSSPVALEKLNLPKSPNDYPDPCAVVQTTLELAPSQEKEIIFFLGQAASSSAARETILRFSSPEECSSALKQVQDRWDALLGTIQVRTPNQALNLLLNRWLLYQVLSCRVWGRSALYQSSGAFGFRDQLQDSMALVYALPQEARAHIIRAAGRQFREGDVQHWWHPQTGAGVRTRIADDPLWLPYVTCNYIAKTGDACILDERIPFLEGPILRPEQDEDYRIPTISNETATLYEHCVRAIDCSLRFGAHGLPLMGTGDWNDGMNRVGSKGKGESVWLGWFLLATLRAFADLAKSRNESDRAATYAERAKRLGEAIETNAWDGRWYRRAYFDDGTPLGSANNVECRIDSIVQSWAVISGGAKEERAREAMAAVHELLVRPSEKVIALFTPPFSDGALDPGYIKGYVPGVRENGGQYTHAALWVVQATALLGIGNKAMGLIDLLNPILHSSSSEELTRYRVEPYVVPADVYSGEPHSGRGGWTWYTGSAGWFYRVALETILGFQLRGNKLAIISHIPSEWQQFAISYRYRSSVYVFSVNNPNALQTAVGRFRIDGQELPGTEFELRDDGHEHQVEVTLVAP